MAAGAEMTVARALELPVLRRGLPEVVAGARSLDTPIRWVHAGEVPDIAALLRGGELLLTTGMGIGAAASQRRFVADLASRGVAGLVVELGGNFVGELPATLVRAADEHELPLIELHATVQFVAVTEAIHTEIVNRDYELLRRGNELRRRFTEAMVSGEGVPAVLSMLAREIGNPVFLQTHDGRLLGHAGPNDAVSDLPGAWAEARDGAEAIGVSSSVASAAGRPPGRLVALPLEGPLDAFAQLAIEQAADIVALALLRSRQEDELLALGRGDLLARLADRRIAPAVAAARAAEMGFVDRRLDRLLPVVARLTLGPDPDRDQAPSANLSWSGTLRDLESALAGLGVPRLLGLHPVDADTALLLLGLRDAEDRTRIADATAAALHRAARRLGGDPAVAVGAACDWDTVGDGLRDAIEAAAVANELPDSPWHDATAIPLERLLWRLGDSEDLHRYVERVLGPLLAHDASRKQSLLPTLEALSTHGGHKTAAARALNLNRQALYARIARLERLLGLDLSESESMATVDLALRARNHLRPGTLRGDAER